MSPTTKPTFVLVPGSSQNPAHYAHLTHLLLTAGYAVVSGLLPSVGTGTPISAAADTAYVRDRLLGPVLDMHERDAVLISHSYSGLLASAAAVGLSKSERTAKGKSRDIDVGHWIEGYDCHCVNRCAWSHGAH